jgi:hypothetical protein
MQRRRAAAAVVLFKRRRLRPSYLPIAAAAASQSTSSCEPVPPEQPTAPMILPFSVVCVSRRPLPDPSRKHAAHTSELARQSHMIVPRCPPRREIWLQNGDVL